MSDYRTGNRTITIKLETTPGEDAGPTVAANAVLVASPQSTPNFGNEETNEVGGSLDDRPPVPTSGSRQFRTRVNNKGSGTAGTPPEFDPFLKIASFGRIDRTADVTGTAQAGAAGSITLAAGDTALANALRGFVIETTGGTGAGQRRIVTANNATSKVAAVTPPWTVTPDNTTTYAVRKGNLYRPQSTVLPTASIYDYGHRSDGGLSKLKKTLGTAAKCTFTMQVNAGCYFEFDCLGSLVNEDDVTNPGPATYMQTRPPPFQNGQVYLGATKVKLRGFTLDLGSEVQQVEDPNAEFGLGTAGITRRRMGGTMALPTALKAVRDAMTSWRDGTLQTLSAIWGGVAGNRFAVLVDGIAYTGQSEQDVSGFAYDGLPFRLSTADDGFSICYW